MAQTILMERPRCPGKSIFWQVPYLRACALCMHSAGQQPGPALVCHSPVVSAVHGARTTCATARAPGSACGPDAHHMDMAAWQQGFRSAALRAA